MSGSTAIIVFTRYPLPGRTKTRLIPALGPEGAAEFHCRMTLSTVGRAWAFCVSDPGTQLVVAFAGGNEAVMREWLGPLHYWPQGDGDLGQRLQRAALRAFDGGAEQVIVIGTDCPSLGEETLAAAVSAARIHGIVFGPAEDGGYYLAGLTDRKHAAIFIDIPWSTGEVLSASITAARALGVEPALLAPLPDVDAPPDIPAAISALTESDRVSVIIPALNEAANLDRLLPVLRAAAPCEIIVADGGSSDQTAAMAASHGVRHLFTPRGRAAQMNAAAGEAIGEFLCFLHADTEPPRNCVDVIQRTLRPPGIAAGAFTFRLREPVAGRRLVEGGVALRCRLCSLPYGDQGLFLRRSLFHAMGGFPDWPILEDLELVRRLRRMGRVMTVPEAALTSSRRWQERGVVRTFLRHQWILAGYALGISPQRLAKWR